MGRITASSVITASLIAACAGCTTPSPVPGHRPAGATETAPTANAAVRASSGARPGAAPRAPVTPARHRGAAAASPRPAPYGAGCQPAALRLALGPRASEATEQATLYLTLTNISTAGCDLQGYPGVALADQAGILLPFSYRWRGDQMLTTSAPVLVPLRAGGTAYLGINKNACVGHSSDAAHRVQVTPPGDYQPLTVATLRYPILDYCPAADPGHTVDVSPVEPSLRGVLNQHLTSG